MPVAQQINQEWVRIVGLIEAAEKGNGKRQLEAASLAFSNRSNFLTIRHLPAKLAPSIRVGNGE
jgi:hypothetical protein